MLRIMFTVTKETTYIELRRQYRDLCKKYHPDRGGSDEMQAQINKEYKIALEQLSELATQNEDRERIMQAILNMYAELKEPLIRKYIPQKYQGLAFEVAKLIEEFN